MSKSSERPDFYRFPGGYKPIEATSFEEAKRILIEKVQQKYEAELRSLTAMKEGQVTCSKCGCDGWFPDPRCPEHEIPF